MSDRARTREQLILFAKSHATALTLAVYALLIAWSWLVPMRRSLWLDETATHYFVTGTWTEFWSRVAVQPQVPPGYYVIMKLLNSTSVPMEWGLRWPSLMALAMSCLLLYLLGSRLFDRATASLATVSFAALPEVANLGVNARPYALGVLCVLAAILLFVGWLDGGHWRDAAGFALASAAALWVHFTLAVVLLLCVGYALFRRRSSGITAGAFIGVGIVIVLLVVPLGLRLAATWRSTTSLAFMNPPAFVDLTKVVAPPLCIAAFIGALRRSNRERNSTQSGQTPVALLLAWAVLPPSLAFAVATFTPAQLFVERYFVTMYPAMALLLGVMLRAFGVLWQRLLLLGVIVLGSGVVSLNRPSEDWREAVDEVRALDLGPDTPVLLSAGFIEAREPALLMAPHLGGYLSSPMFSYPIPGRVIPIPDARVPSTEAMIDQTVDSIMQSEERVVVLSRSFHPILRWLQTRAREAGYSWRELGQFPGVTAALVERARQSRSVQPAFKRSASSASRGTQESSR